MSKTTTPCTLDEANSFAGVFWTYFTGWCLPVLLVILDDRSHLPKWVFLAAYCIRSVIEAPGANNSAAARALFDMLPGLPAEGRVRATEEAIQRTPSAEYRTLAQPILSNPGTYPPSLIVLFSDLMERPPEVQLPVLLAIARNSEHPLAKQAQENLEFVLKQNAGTDWNRWEAAIREKLTVRP